MQKTVEYFVVPSSPWCYLGHARLSEIAGRRKAAIDMKPFDLGRVFPLTGGVPLPKRAPQRQAYRLEELARWSRHLGVPMNVEPRFFPADPWPAMLLIATTQLSHGEQPAFDLCGAIMRGLWAQERNIADPDTLAEIARECGLDGASLIGHSAAARPDVERHTEEAIEAGVFGAPWFRYQGMNFWGQDRLDFLDRALAT